MKSFFCLSGLLCLCFFNTIAQFPVTAGKTYTIDQILIEGSGQIYAAEIQALCRLEPGDQLIYPGPQSTEIMKRIWASQLFSDISLGIDSVGPQSHTLRLYVQSTQRLTQFSIRGLNKQREKELREQLKLTRGMLFPFGKNHEIEQKVRVYLDSEGFREARIDLIRKDDQVIKNGVVLSIKIDPGPRSHIHQIQISDQSILSKKEQRKALYPLQAREGWKLWATSRYTKETMIQAKKQLLKAYQNKGYLDAEIVFEGLDLEDPRKVEVQLQVIPGKKYYVRNIEWTGMSLYSKEQLQSRLKIRAGMVYRPGYLSERLYGSPEGDDIASLYLDRGYLFFQANPIMQSMTGDSIDLNIAIYEGQPAVIKRNIVRGNTTTADHVIHRELYTQPGDVFTRSAIILSQQRLLALQYFAQEKMRVDPIPNPEEGTVDIVYHLEEQSTDQFQLRGSWAPKVENEAGEVIGGGLTGTLQLVSNNFSLRRLLKPDSWNPIPSGDGQQLNLSLQSNGANYTHFGFGFQEPWLGGRKPTLLGLNVGLQRYNSIVESENPFKSKSLSTALTFGRRLSFPDAFTRLNMELGYRYYDLENPGQLYPVFEDQSNAYVNILALKTQIHRNTLDHPHFPKNGHEVSLSLSMTPPYSLFPGEHQAAVESYRLLEFHKWQLKGRFYKSLHNRLVLHGSIEGGYVGAYQSALGISPFERFALGGYGILSTGNTGLMGLDLVPLRGYNAQDFDNDQANYPLYQRATVELRYQLIQKGEMPLWVLGFAEAGNGYQNLKSYDPLSLKRSAGLGIRTVLPFVGLIGLDWAYGFDPIEGQSSPSGSQWHIILGREF